MARPLRFEFPGAMYRVMARGNGRQRLFHAKDVAAVAEFYGVTAEAYRVQRSQAAGRDLATYLAHHRTTATLRGLAELFGLGHPDSISNLNRKADWRLANSNKSR